MRKGETVIEVNICENIGVASKVLVDIEDATKQSHLNSRLGTNCSKPDVTAQLMVSKIKHHNINVVDSYFGGHCGIFDPHESSFPVYMEN